MAPDPSTLIPAIRFACRQLSRRGNTEAVRSQLSAEIRSACTDDDPVTDAEIKTIFAEADKILSGKL
jgi:hypothetical protein